jgi:hypothetical protein
MEGGAAMTTPTSTAISRHDCRCSSRPFCLAHGASEWGGGEPDICAPHGHERPEETPTPIDVDLLAQAMAGLVFMDAASNRRIAAAVAREYAVLAVIRDEASKP